MHGDLGVACSSHGARCYGDADEDATTTYDPGGCTLFAYSATTSRSMIAILCTAWLSFLAWASANGLRALHSVAAARIVWILGSVTLLVHVLLAFHLVHGWDHEAAYADVARQTYDLTGIDWGGGLYINHAFTAFWLADALFWWLAPRRYESRPLALDGIIQLGFLFMFVNATVVFGRSSVAPAAGAALCVVSAVSWCRWASRRHEARRTNDRKVSL
jgi:hypothetical protein